MLSMGLILVGCGQVWASDLKFEVVDPATPPMTYTPDEVWPIPGGFCGRWYCEMGEDGSLGRIRGFDLVLLDGDRIALNEVYVHALP